MRSSLTALAAALACATAFAVPARAADPIKIGFSMSLTGPLSSAAIAGVAAQAMARMMNSERFMVTMQCEE